MATRSRTSFQKRQKEIARMEKQRDKAARRAMRKLGGGENAEPDPDSLWMAQSTRKAQPTEQTLQTRQMQSRCTGRPEPAAEHTESGSRVG